MGRGVGSFEQVGGFGQDRFGDADGILRHVAVPEPDHGPAFAFQRRRPRRVARIVGVLAAVDFNRKPRRSACEIEDERTLDQLTREFRAVARQQAPHRSLGAGGIGAERAGAAGHLGADAVHGGMVTQGALRAYPAPTPSLK